MKKREYHIEREKAEPEPDKKQKVKFSKKKQKPVSKRELQSNP